MNAKELASTLAVLAAALGPRHAQAVQDLAACGQDDGEETLQTHPWLTQLQRAAQVAGALEVEKDYVRLFFSPRGALCPPWEGVWVGESPRLFGPRHESVLTFARRLGVEPPDYERESADHIATELTLAGFFLSSENPGVFHEFWDQHLQPWVSVFGRCLEEHASTDFYRLVGRALQELADTTRRSLFPADPSFDLYEQGR
ncbi:MAG: molecular chaperone [Thermoanaerobaculum sp.]